MNNYTIILFILSMAVVLNASFLLAMHIVSSRLIRKADADIKYRVNSAFLIGILVYAVVGLTLGMYGIGYALGVANGTV